MINFDAFARLYDADYGDFTADLDFYLQFAQRTGGPILEAMCGTGRVLLPLALAGHTVVGVDIAPAMIELAQSKVVTAGLANARTAVGDLRSLALPERFAMALIAMNSFMHLATPSDQLEALERLHEHLRPDGLLILDLFNPDPRELVADEGLLVHVSSFTFEQQLVQKYMLRRTNVAEQTHYVEFMYDEIGADRLLKRSVLPFTMRWVYRYELEYLLGHAGFTLEAIYGSYELDPYTSDSERLLAVAQPLRRARGRRRRD